MYLVHFSPLFHVKVTDCIFIQPFHFNLCKTRDLQLGFFFLFHLRIQRNSVFVTPIMSQTVHLPANLCRGFWSLLWCLLQARWLCAHGLHRSGFGQGSAESAASVPCQPLGMQPARLLGLGVTQPCPLPPGSQGITPGMNPEKGQTTWGWSGQTLKNSGGGLGCKFQLINTLLQWLNNARDL